MASTENLCSAVFLLVAISAFITSASSADSDDYIFGYDEDKFLLPFVVLVLIVAIVLVVFAAVIFYLALKKQSNNRNQQTFHMAAHPAHFTSFSEKREMQNKNRGLETGTASGVVYDNPVPLDDENTNGNAKKASRDSGPAGNNDKAGQKEHEKESFDNPGYVDNATKGSAAQNDYEESASPSPEKLSSTEISVM